MKSYKGEQILRTRTGETLTGLLLNNSFSLTLHLTGKNSSVISLIMSVKSKWFVWTPLKESLLYSQTEMRWLIYKLLSLRRLFSIKEIRCLTEWLISTETVSKPYAARQIKLITIFFYIWPPSDLFYIFSHIRLANKWDITCIKCFEISHKFCPKCLFLHSHISTLIITVIPVKKWEKKR